tara:strand:+ start:3480 stop:4220 length:741 start_codon:yes stop_codon:yes gene_type:complete
MIDKAYQRIMRDKIEAKSYDNLFGESLYPDDASFKTSNVCEISFVEAKKIIMKYEWLQSMPHRFGYRVSHGIYFKKTLGGALVYAQPQVRSLGLFGQDFGTRSVIQLSRGACAFWTPKGTATRLISQSCKILKKEGIAGIVAYCTPEAGEIGTIYQASNFIYYGQTNGSWEYYLDNRWIGERSFAHKKKWLSNQTGEVKKMYKESFDNIEKRRVLPRYKYIKILNRKAKKSFKHESLPYPKRTNAE